MGHASGPSVDPSLYSPQNNHFAAAMRDGPHEHGHFYSPVHHANSVSNGMDQVFAEFVTDPSDDVGPRNELVEQLEDGRQEDDEGETGRFIDDYLNQAP